VGLPAGVVPVAADVTRAEGLRGALPEALDAVVYAVGPDCRDEAAYRAAYVDGLRNVVKALDGPGRRPGRFLHVSSVGVYGQDAGQWVDEGTPPGSAGFTGRLLLEGEVLLRGAAPSGVVVRLGGIYGPGRARLLDRVRRGEGPGPGDERWLNQVHRDDCAGLLHHLIEHPAPAPLYLGVDDEPARLTTVLAWLFDRLGAPRPGDWPEPPSDGSGRGKRCSNARLRASGYRLRHPTFREGYASLLAEVPLP
jgi:nucleoside-diphosphate-sugar epimerase